MPNFRYRAVTDTGEIITGIEHGPSVNSIANMLIHQQLMPLDVREKRSFRLNLERFFPSGAPSELRLQALDYLSTLLEAGLSLTVSLETIAEQVDHEGLRLLYRDLGTMVENGKSFSEAVQKYPRYFPTLHLNMIRAGEKSGKLPEILRKLVEHMEWEAEIRKKLIEASIYPGLILFLATVIVGLLLAFVVPHFVKLLEQTGVALPLPTRILISVSDLLRSYGLIGAAAVGLFISAIPRLLRVDRIRLLRDKLILRIPVVNGLVRKTAIARFTKTLGTLIMSGLPFLPSLLLVGPVLGNMVLQSAVKRIHRAVEGGEEFASPLWREPLFPPMVVQMVAVGEATGTLDIMLQKIGNHYDREVAGATKKLTAVVEPALIVVIGLIVGFVALALVLPMLKAVSGLGR